MQCWFSPAKMLRELLIQYTTNMVHEASGKYKVRSDEEHPSVFYIVIFSSPTSCVTHRPKYSEISE